MEEENKKCPQCSSLLYHNVGISKKTGKKYENYKCGKCGYLEWVDNKPSQPKPTGGVEKKDRFDELLEADRKIFAKLLEMEREQKTFFKIFTNSGATQEDDAEIKDL